MNANVSRNSRANTSRAAGLFSAHRHALNESKRVHAAKPTAGNWIAKAGACETFRTSPAVATMGSELPTPGPTLCRPRDRRQSPRRRPTTWRAQNPAISRARRHLRQIRGRTSRTSCPVLRWALSGCITSTPTRPSPSAATGPGVSSSSAASASSAATRSSTWARARLVEVAPRHRARSGRARPVPTGYPSQPRRAP
jgi:hypothetical protein